MGISESRESFLALPEPLPFPSLVRLADGGLNTPQSFANVGPLSLGDRADLFFSPAATSGKARQARAKAHYQMRLYESEKEAV